MLPDISERGSSGFDAVSSFEVSSLMASVGTQRTSGSCDSAIVKLYKTV